MKGFLLKKKSKKGFTLVELVIVVAVLAIIAGIAIPTVHNVIGDANQAADATNAQSIELAIKTFAAEKAAGTDVPTISSTKLTDLLSAYGVNLDLTDLKESSKYYYYDSTSGKVTVGTSGGEKLTNDATFTLENFKIVIDGDGKT